MSSDAHNAWEPTLEREERVGLPSWVGSIAFHGVLLIVVFVLWSLAPGRPQAAGERTTGEIGIVLAHDMPDGETFFETEGEGVEEASESDAADAPSMDEIFSDSTSIDVSADLPEMNVIGAASSGDEGAAAAVSALSGPVGTGKTPGGGAKVKLIETEGEGFRFVFVIDRSASMSGNDHRPMRIARAHLKAAIDALGPSHQFSIIFFNEKAKVFQSLEGGARAFATDQNKITAERFVNSITPDGGTDHEAALMRAIHLQPEVIFFLTDAGEPGMSQASLYRIRRAAGCSINAIEFGSGPEPNGDNFLKQLARENQGQYSYLDTTSGAP